MAIKNKDGSTYSFTKPPPQMTDQTFWDNREKVLVHNKFGQRYLREKTGDEDIDMSKIKREVKLPDFEEVKADDIKIVQAIETPKSKPLHEDVIDIWCLPCVQHTENIDPLYDESYDKIEYGSPFIFQARLLSLEDLSVQFIAEAGVNVPMQSVVYPKTASRRWWRIRGVKEVKDFKLYLGGISDYQPSFEN